MLAEIEILFPNAVNGVDFKLRDDGNGVFISEWNLADPQPDAAALLAVKAAADTVRSNGQAKVNRDREYPSLDDKVLALLNTGTDLVDVKDKIDTVNIKYPLI